MSNTQVIRPSELPEILAYSWAKDHPVLVMGPSGCGKSSIIEQQARVRGQELGYECFWKLGDPLPANPANTFAFIDFRLASMDASDVKGFGSLDMDEGITRFLPPENMPRIDTHGAAGYLFADEIDKADDGAVDSFTQLMLTKVLGSYLFPPTWRIVSAANRKQDGTGGGKVKSHVVGRGGTFEMEPNVADFCSFDLSEGGSPAVHAFLRSVDGMIYSRDKSDVAYASARGWSMASEAVQSIDDPKLQRRIVAGFVGKAASDALAGFQSLIASGAEIASWASIKADPMTAPIPSQSNSHRNALAYAAIGIIAAQVTKDSLTSEDMEVVLAYAGRLDSEHATTLMHDLRVRDNAKLDPASKLYQADWHSLFDTHAANRWIADNPNASV